MRSPFAFGIPCGAVSDFDSISLSASTPTPELNTFEGLIGRVKMKFSIEKIGNNITLYAGKYKDPKYDCEYIFARSGGHRLDTLLIYSSVLALIATFFVLSSHYP
jgi:hypothetical protein